MYADGSALPAGGVIAREVGNGDIENIYRVKVMNATEHTQSYMASVQGLPGLTLVTDPLVTVPATDIGSLTVRLTLAAEAAQAYRGQAVPIRITLETHDQGETVAVDEKSTFVVPR